MTVEENECGSQFCSKTQVLGLMIGLKWSDTEDELPHSISYGIVIISKAETPLIHALDGDLCWLNKLLNSYLGTHRVKRLITPDILCKGFNHRSQCDRNEIGWATTFSRRFCKALMTNEASTHGFCGLYTSKFWALTSTLQFCQPYKSIKCNHNAPIQKIMWKYNQACSTSPHWYIYIYIYIYIYNYHMQWICWPSGNNPEIT